MKNKFLIGTITVFVAIFFSIVLLNILKIDEKIVFNFFERKFSKDTLLTLENENNRLIEKGMPSIFFSNNVICEGKLNSFNDKNNDLEVVFNDFEFKNKIQKHIKLPKNANILLIDKNCVIYTYQKKINKIDFNGNKSFEINAKNIDISIIIDLKNNDSEYLFIGQAFKDNEYKTGFFKLNFETGNITDSKILISNKSHFSPETVVKYSGLFQNLNSDDEQLAFVCDKNCKIFLFDKQGNFLNIFESKDKTPEANVINNNKGDIYYSRNRTNFSNSGLFYNNDKIYIFSMASKYKTALIIDEYDKNMVYIKSFKINYKNYYCFDISQIYVENNHVILKFPLNYASFKLSIYN